MHSSNHRIGAASRDHRCCHLRHMPAKRCKKESLYKCLWTQTNTNGNVYKRDLYYCEDHINIFAEKYNVEIPNVYEIFENLNTDTKEHVHEKVRYDVQKH